VWWARREIEAAEEECCDGWVVERQQGTRHAYAEALLTTIDFLCERPVVAAPSACGLGEVELLRVRLTQIMKGPAAGQLSRTGWIAVFAAGIMISPLEPALLASSTPRLADSPRNVPKDDRTSASVSAAVQEIQPRAKRTVATRSIDRTKTRPAASLPTERVAPKAPSLMSRPLPALWATATSPDGRHRLQWRTQRRTVLSSTQGSFRVDLSAHGFRCVSFAPDSATFASGHDDSLVRLWDSETGGLIASLKGSPAAITSVHMSSDGIRVAAGAADGSVLVWEAESGDVLAQLPPQAAPVSCLRWDPSSDRLAIALGGFTSETSAAGLLIWSPVNGVVLAENPLAEPAGALDWVDDGTLMLASWSGAARLWSIAAGAPIAEYQVDKNQVSAASWSPDCPLIARPVDDQLLSRIED
jgi:WD40 repeat protein